MIGRAVPIPAINLSLMQEYLQGVPAGLCCKTVGNGGRTSVSGSNSLFPEPRSDPRDGSPQDIAFSMMEGDFVVSLSPSRSSLQPSIT